jgi:leucyl aminopeptidase
LIGCNNKLVSSEIINCFRNFSFTYKSKLKSSISIDLIHSNITDIKLPEYIVNGLLLGGYSINLYKTDTKIAHPLSVTSSIFNFYIDSRFRNASDYITKGLTIAEVQCKIMDLVNAPGNKKLPKDIANAAMKSGEKYGFECKWFNKEQCKQNNLHALLSVNEGSEHDPAFIIMHYKPSNINENTPKVGIIGKGVTFDTGGISIKDSTNMHLMKSDMAGAGAVLGAIELVARMKLKVEVIAIIPSTENMADGKSTKPGDVIQSFAGKTIEVTDTDAEGRLILADALNFMVKNHNPDHIIDLATLTGSIVRTFGQHYAGLFTNNDTLSNLLIQSGETSGERLWRLPLHEAYAEDVKSDIADVLNFSGKPTAGAISAAKFLECFIDNHPSWAHLDIAGVAFYQIDTATQRSATAFGIRLLLEFIKNLQ